MFTDAYSKLEPDEESALATVAPMTVPDSFDGRSVWALYLPPVKNQCNCGGCWAFAATACLAARINIWTTNRVHVNLSPSNLIFCNWGSEQEYKIVKRAFQMGLDFTELMDDINRSLQNVGCSGETLIGAWQFLFRYGASTEECHPYNGDPNAKIPQFNLCNYVPGQQLPSCMQVSGPDMAQCQNGDTEKRYRAGGFYLVAGPVDIQHFGGRKSEDEEFKVKDAAKGGNVRESSREQTDRRRKHIDDNVYKIKREIWKYGPVTTGMNVYSDLFNWKGKGVYQWDGKSELTGGHAVLITGWGEQGGVPYWQIMNSWGREWGDGGYFRILRGQNHCDVEVNVMTGYPDMPLSDRFLLQPRMRTPEDLFLRHVWDYDDSGYDLMQIHKMILDEQPERNVAPIYTASMVPDYRVMLAGEPRKITYPYAVSRIKVGMLVFTLLLGLLLLALVWYIHNE